MVVQSTTDRRLDPNKGRGSRKPIQTRELAEAAVQLMKDETLFFSMRSEGEEDCDCAIACVEFAGTSCLLATTLGDGFSSALNITTYDEGLTNIVEWLDEFCSQDAIIMA